jgi:hypothetical protein
LPGDSVPPSINVAGSEPVPPTVAPVLTVRKLDCSMLPLTISAPALTVVVPV